MTTSPDLQTTEGPAPVTIGDTVAYRARTRGYALSATVTATTDTLDPEGVRLGHVPPLSSPWHVHLHVLTPGQQVQYQEFDVPYDPTGAPGTWDAATSTRHAVRYTEGKHGRIGECSCGSFALVDRLPGWESSHRQPRSPR